MRVESKPAMPYCIRPYKSARGTSTSFGHPLKLDETQRRDKRRAFQGVEVDNVQEKTFTQIKRAEYLTFPGRVEGSLDPRWGPLPDDANRI